MRLKHKKYELTVEFKVEKNGFDFRRCKLLPYIELTDGDFYYDLRDRFKYWICLGWLSTRVQKYLWGKKIYWHDIIMHQCTPYFECCRHKIKPEHMDFFKQICYARDEQIGTVYINKGDNHDR